MTDADYEVAHDPAWNLSAATSANVEVLPDEDDPVEIRIEGPCPFCDHETLHVEPLLLLTGVATDEVDESVTRGLRDLLRKSGKRISSRDVEVVCACANDHPGGPEGVAGCGRSWVLNVAWGAGL